MKFVTLRACQFQGRVYREGEVLMYSNPIEPCERCAGSGKFKGNTCPKCRGTGRQTPPHHFAPEDSTMVEQANPSNEVSEAELISAIRKEHDDIGAGYDKRWGVKKLQDNLLAAKKGRGLV